MVNCQIDYLNPPTIMAHFARNNGNYYWNGGAFCVNCGKLEGNVTNNGVHPIWHRDCKSGCNSTWEDQDPICEDYEYAELMEEEERWRNACRDPREEDQEAEESYLEYERRREEYARQEEEEELEEGEIAETKEERMEQCYRNQLESEMEFTNMVYEELLRQDQEREQRESGYFFGIACDRMYYNTFDEY